MNAVMTHTAAETEGTAGARRWPQVATAALVAATFAALVLWGLAWGIPSRRRARLEGQPGALKDLPPELVSESWRHFGSRGRRTEQAAPFPRHLFNPVRSYHPDEYQVFKSLGHMDPTRLNFNPGNYIYPSLHTYLVGATLGVCWAGGLVKIERDIQYYFEHPGQMGRLYVVGRVLTLLAALATLAMVARTGGRGVAGSQGRWSVGPWVGVVAAAVLAAMPALCVHSHHLTRDTCAALAAVLLFAACRRAADTGEAKWLDVAGGAAGLCAAFQYFAVVAWAMVPVAAWLHWRRTRSAWRGVAGRVAVSLLVMAAVFCLASPYHVLNLGQFVADFRSETSHVGAGGLLGRLSPLRIVPHLFRMMPAMLTWPLTVAVCLAIAVALARRERDDVLLLAWLVLWAGVVGFDGRSYSRYYVPLLPCLALLCARAFGWGAAALGRVVRLRALHAALCVAALAALLAYPAAVSAAWARLYSRVNVRTLAGETIATEVPAGSRIGVTKWPWQFEMPPLDPQRYRLLVLEEPPPHDPHNLALLRRLKPRYVVTSSLQYGRMRETPVVRNDSDRFWHWLLVSGEDYVVWRPCHVGLRLFGREVDLAGYPEDMRYVNPEIVVLQLAVSDAVAWRGGPGGGP